MISLIKALYSTTSYRIYSYSLFTLHGPILTVTIFHHITNDLKLVLVFITWSHSKESQYSIMLYYSIISTIFHHMESTVAVCLHYMVSLISHCIPSLHGLTYQSLYSIITWSHLFSHCIPSLHGLTYSVTVFHHYMVSLIQSLYSIITWSHLFSHCIPSLHGLTYQSLYSIITWSHLFSYCIPSLHGLTHRVYYIYVYSITPYRIYSFSPFILHSLTHTGPVFHHIT